MTSAYGKDDLDVAPKYEYRHGVNERAARSLTLAGTVVGLIGVVNLIQGIAVLAGSKVYPDNAVFTFAGDRVWGWVALAAGVVEIAASFAIFTKSAAARTIGIAVGAGNAVSQLLVMPARPLWAVAMIALDLLVIRALLVYGKSAPLQ